MITQIVYLSVNLSNRDIFIAEVLANARESVKELGVLRFDVLQQEDDPESFVLYEVYESPEALENHRQSVHFKRWQEVGVPLLSGPRRRVLYKTISL
jgi:(4S)-4-hydroxy-5-phosphonooxypentane-2,3-dione isomerase